jgi:methylated-DNA-[protein]-cysteine S-methyltransferase
LTTAPQLVAGRLSSPLGDILVVWDRERRLRALDFEDNEPRLRRILVRHYGAAAEQTTAGRAPSELADPIAAYFDGRTEALDAIPVATAGTSFQRAVWSALRDIPSGTTTTYGELAARVGRPTACRAAGAANGANPISIVVPCHRVIGSDRSLTGYGGGMERKRWLLAHEERHRSGASRRSA